MLLRACIKCKNQMKKAISNMGSIKVVLAILLVITFLSCSEILIEKDISDSTVELVAPVNNAQFLSTSVTFTWNNVDDATEYQLQIAKPNFASPMQIVLDTVISTTSFTQQLAIGGYEWRVRAINSSYHTAYSSRFVTVASNDDFQSNTVLLISPSNNLITNTALQTLTWQSIIGATSYQLQVYNDSNTLILDQNMSSTSYNYTFPEGSYQWRVRASNGTETTLYSSRSALVDLTVPNTPTLTSPANSSSTTATDISFQWSRTPIVGSTEKDYIYIYTNSTLTNLLFEGQVASPYPKTLTSGTYYWRIKAIDLAGNQGSVSNTFSFTIN